MKSMRKCNSVRSAILSAIVALSLMPSMAAANHSRLVVPGTWYLALDATPYGLEGLSLPGLVALHADRTVLMSDAGDFGGLPFGTRDSAQFGSWKYTRGGIKVVALFLKADSAGDVMAWYRVELSLSGRNRNTLKGTVNVFTRSCDRPAPFAAFSCPDPIETAGEFVPADLPDVPVILRRLRP